MMTVDVARKRRPIAAQRRPPTARSAPIADWRARRPTANSASIMGTPMRNAMHT